MDREELKIKAELKKVAKTGNRKAIATYAKSVIRARKQRERMVEGKTRINSVILQIKQAEGNSIAVSSGHLSPSERCFAPSATAKVAGHMQKSTEVMKSVQSLMSLPECAEVARNLAQEMMKV